MPGRTGTGPESGQLASLLLEHLDAPVIAVSADGSICLANQAARRLLGLTEQEPLPQQPIWTLLDSADDTDAKEQIKCVLTRDRPIRVEVVLAGPNGSPRSLLWRWTPMPRPHEDGPRAVAVGTDVTLDVKARKDARDAILASEARIGALIQAMPDLVFRMDKDGRFLEFYASCETMLYAQPEEIVGHTLHDLLPDPVASASLDCLRRALATGLVQSHEYALPVSPGHRFFEARHIATGGGDEVLAIVRDITDRRLTEEALRESEQQYRMLMDRASDAIVLTREAGHFVYANQQACRLLGRSESELLTMGFADLVPDEDVPCMTDDLESLREGEAQRIVRSLRHGEGHFVDVEMSVAVLPDGWVQWIMRDITERRRALEALRRSEESFRLLIERMPAVILVHSEGRIVWVNESCARMFGVPAESLVGRSPLELLHPDDRSLAIERIRRQQQTGEPAPPVEERFIRADGSVSTGEVLAIPLQFQGKPSSIVIAYDLTERKRAEAQRRALEERIQNTQKLESLGVLAGGIAHDFNNLLMGVLGNASLALMDLGPASPARESVERIEIAAHRAAELTRQLLAYSGRGRFLVQPLKLSRLVEEMVHLLQTIISKKAALRLDFAKDLPFIEADATQIRQVVMNLITNASDALQDDSGVIVVRTGVMNVNSPYLAGMYLDEDIEPGEFVFVEVSDTGCGMDSESVHKIFDPFYTTKFTGRGLGLAAVIGIVRGHRGAIKVYSEPNRGSCFKVFFPSASGPSSSAPPAPEPTDAWRGSGTVLVVDDEETVRAVARLALERQGFEVLTANDGVEALEVYDANPGAIGLVILDMTMPRMGGEDTFRELRKRNPDLKIVVSSGYNEQETVSRFMGRGLAGFIQKPYTPSDLMTRVKAVLGA